MKLTKIFDTNMSHAIIVVSNQFGELEFNVKHVKTLTFAKVIHLITIDCYDKNLTIE